MLLFGRTAHAATYTWIGTGGDASWANGANWDPARTLLANDDVLIFDGSRTPTVSVFVDFPSPQTIEQIRFINNVVVLLTVRSLADINATTPAQQLNIAGTLLGSDFEIMAGSSVQVRSPDGRRAAAGLTLQLGVEATATISGTLIFGNSSSAVMNTNDPHRLVSLAGKASNAIQFNSGSLFRAERLFSGEAFGAGTALNNTVIFMSGSTYEQRGGGAPFANNQPNAVVSFTEGSRYIYATNTSPGPQLPGRIYGFLEYDGTNSSTIGSASLSSARTIILNDLLIRQGNIRLNVAAVDITGNLILNGGTLVNPTGESVITFNGNAPQRIISSTTTPVSLGTNVILAINNAAGVTLQTPMQVAKALTLTNGKLTTTAAPLTLLAGANITANENSFIAGPLTRIASASGTTSLEFPIGSGTAFRPLVLTVTHADGAEARYTAEQIKGRSSARTFTGDIKKVSAVRYFNVTRTSAANNFVSGNIQLSYGADDEVDAPAKLRIAKSSADNSSWESLGGMGSGAPAGTIASGTPFTSFGTFALASTEAGSGLGSNPLPVELTAFTAKRQANGVTLNWTTATEKNNAYFEVQRSLNGIDFSRLERVVGRGTTTDRQSYTLTDHTPLPQATYYRLRQVDMDGTATFSPVTGVTAVLGETVLFPNPAHHQLTFRLVDEDAAMYRVLASTGQAVRQGQTTTGATTLDVSALPTGLYYLEVETTEGRLVRKFMKQAD